MYRIIRQLVEFRQNVASSLAWYIRFLPYMIFLGVLLYTHISFWLLTSVVFLTMHITELSIERGNMMLSTLVIVAGFALFTAATEILFKGINGLIGLKLLISLLGLHIVKRLKRIFSAGFVGKKHDPYLAGQRMFLSQLSEDQLAQRFKRKYFRGIWSIYMIEAFVYNASNTEGINHTASELSDWIDSVQGGPSNTAYDNLFRLNTGSTFVCDVLHIR